MQVLSSCIALAYFLDSNQSTMSVTIINTKNKPAIIAITLASASENLASGRSLIEGAFPYYKLGFMKATSTPTINMSEERKAYLIQAASKNLESETCLLIVIKKYDMIGIITETNIM
jgi:hypothetical protein